MYAHARTRNLTMHVCALLTPTPTPTRHTHTTKGYLKSDYSKSKPDTPSAGTVSCKKAADPNRANLVVHVAGPKDGARSVTSLHMTLQL